MSHDFKDGGSGVPFQGRSLTLEHTWEFEHLDLLVPPDFRLPKGLKGSLHRKQKISYVTSGRNPTDLDLLDEGSEY